MSANVPQRMRAYSAPPCPHHVEDTAGQRVCTILYEIGEDQPGVQCPKIVDWEWQVNRGEATESNGNLKEIFVPVATKAGDLLLPSPIEVLKILMRDPVDLGTTDNTEESTKQMNPTPNQDGTENVSESHDAKKLNCSGDPLSCVMCALLEYYQPLVKYITCLQHVQGKKGCKHGEKCEYCHPTPEEIGDNKDECKVFKLTGFCRFRHPQPGQKQCPKQHHEAGVPPKYLPTITHKLCSEELYYEAMACIHKFVQHMNENP